MGAARRAADIMAAARRMADQLASAGGLAAIPTADELTPDHPYSRAFGFDRARLLLNPELAPRRAKAAERRSIVERMSLAKCRVREIADHVGISTDYVVKLRARLREEGRLPSL